MSAAVEIQNLSVTIGKTPLISDITATIQEGHVVGLLGPSGSGKTTLIRSILGLQRPTMGTVTVMGRAAGQNQAKSSIGYVSQSPSVYADLTVKENVNYFAKLLGLDKSAGAPVIQKVELDSYQDHLVGDLSGGQRMRVSLAVALLGTPKLLLLDEPTVGLDPVLRQKLWDIFKSLAAGGTTLLISSHVMDEAERCDSVMFLRAGHLLVTDTKEAIYFQTGTTTMEAAFLKLVTELTP